jgi:hypothetical protein
MSKGSKPRPFSISQHEYDTRWDNIFSRDLKDDTEEKVIEEVSKLIAEETLQATESK